MHNRPLLFAEFTTIKHLKHIYLARLYQLTSCIENQPARGTVCCDPLGSLFTTIVRFHSRSGQEFDKTHI